MPFVEPPYDVYLSTVPMEVLVSWCGQLRGLGVVGWGKQEGFVGQDLWTYLRQPAFLDRHNIFSSQQSVVFMVNRGRGGNFGRWKLENGGGECWRGC